MTPGVNRLPPVGLTPFSVGVGAAALGDVVVVVVVVVEGASPPLFPQALAKAPIAISAEPLATTIRRRLIRPVYTIHVLFWVSCCDGRRAVRSARAAP